MWVRLRRLSIVKNTVTSKVQAIMKDRASSVNPLHPSMAEVQAVAREHVDRCERRAAVLARLSGARAPAAPGSAAAARGAAPQPPSASASHVHEADRRGDVEGRAGGPGRRPLPTRGDSNTPYPAEHPGRGQRHPTRGQGASTLPSDEVDRVRVGGSDGVGRGDGGGRGTKRPLAAIDSGAGAGEAAVAFGSERAVSNLLSVRRTPAPETFDVRAKIVAHFPAEVRPQSRRVGASCAVVGLGGKRSRCGVAWLPVPSSSARSVGGFSSRSAGFEGSWEAFLGRRNRRWR